MRTNTIEPEVLEVLKRSAISATTLQLPEGNLSRDLYQKVFKVIANAGGRWDKKTKSHVFEYDPRDRLGLAVSKGAITIEKTEKQIYQAFFTPPELASLLVESIGVSGKKVLEPSAGHGAIANECLAQGAAQVDCIELNPVHMPLLKEKHPTAVEADFLSITPKRDYDRIVMNPPFTKNQDIKHVGHALGFLKKGGKLVSIMAGNTNRPWFKSMPMEVRSLPASSFKASGTNVNTVMVTIHG